MAKKNDQPPRASELVQQAEKLLEDGITRSESYCAALLKMAEIRKRLVSLKSLVKGLENAARRLSDTAAEYAMNRKTAVEGGKGLTEYKPNVMRGKIIIDEKVFTLTVSPGPLKRVNGDNMTQDFLRSLPTSWIREIAELDTDTIKRMGVSDAELVEHDLIRLEKRVWAISDLPNAQDAQGVDE